MTILQDRERIFSSSILRLVGYSLLLMAIVNISFLLIPLHLTNPLWEFQTVGAIIERIPFILLGIVLICYGERSNRASVELSVLKGLSWFSLISAIALLLVIPLNINNSLRIYYQNNPHDNVHLLNQENAIEQFKDRLLVANSKDEITAILQQQIKDINISDSVNIQEFKDNIFVTLKNYRYDITSQIQTFKAQKRSLLIKNCLKWDIGALISAILFFLIWKSTGWARTKVIPNKN